MRNSIVRGKDRKTASTKLASVRASSAPAGGDQKQYIGVEK